MDTREMRTHYTREWLSGVEYLERLQSDIGETGTTRVPRVNQDKVQLTRIRMATKIFYEVDSDARQRGTRNEEDEKRALAHSNYALLIML